MHTRKLLSFLFMLFFAVALFPAQAAPKYKVILLGASNADGGAINDFGWVAGSLMDANNTEHPVIFFGATFTYLGDFGGAQNRATAITHYGAAAGFVTLGGLDQAALFSNGQIKLLGTLGGDRSVAYGINNLLQVVGYARTKAKFGNATPQHAFLYDSSMHDLGTLGGSFSAALDINNAGQIIGVSDTAGNKTRHLFLYADGVMTDLGNMPGFDYFQSGVINNLGQATGTMLPTFQHTQGRAFLYKNGAFKDIGLLPGGSLANGHDINDNGQIVGFCAGNDLYTGFLYSDGVMMDLNDLFDHNVFPYNIQSAGSINNAGQIVAYGYSTIHGFQAVLRLDPVP
jgi:probable HAF family extracellular repeat protein